MADIRCDDQEIARKKRAVHALMTKIARGEEVESTTIKRSIQEIQEIVRRRPRVTEEQLNRRAGL